MNMKPVIIMGHLIIPSGTEQIYPRTYEGNMRIRSVIVPESVKTIGVRAFANCKNLTSITLCEGIETIESNAFTGCNKLKSIQLPASIKQITGWAFYDSGLQKPVLSADGRILVCCPQAASGTEYSVPKSVREIGMQAFVELHNLQRVILPEGLQVIRERAFIACGLESVSLPKSIKHIEAGAFYDCEKLKDVTGLQKSDLVEYADEFWRIQGKRLTMPCGTDQPQIRHWDESEFQSIARRCAEADASAMYQMKEYFHHKSLQYPDVTFYARAANFWLYRAYQYGNQEAKMFLAKWTDAHPGQRLRTVRLSNSLGGTLQGYLLNAMGFLDFEEEREYTLHCVDKEGLVLVDSYESEDGPDEDGYGSEIYYDWWFVDDCLNFIPGAPLLHSYSSNDMRSKSAEQKLSDIHEQTVKLRKRKIVE